MALILPGAGLADIRGSVGGTTFARNHYGNYCRNRTKPYNPNSPDQLRARAAVAMLSTYWRDTMSAAQRSAWNAYAAGTNWLNSLGQTIKLTGQAHFVRSQTIRLLVGDSVNPVAPTTPGIPDQATAWTPSADISDNEISIDFTFPVTVNSQDYAFFVSQPTSVGRSFFAGPWRFLGSINGDSASPPKPSATRGCWAPAR